MFKELFQSALHLAVVPVEIVKDVATMGGVLTDNREGMSKLKFKNTWGLFCPRCGQEWFCPCKTCEKNDANV